MELIHVGFTYYGPEELLLLSSLPHLQRHLSVNLTVILGRGPFVVLKREIGT